MLLNLDYTSPPPGRDPPVAMNILLQFKLISFGYVVCYVLLICIAANQRRPLISENESVIDPS